MLVGRDGESGLLEGALRRALAGEPGAVFIGGEAGVGKSHLVREFLRRSDLVTGHASGHEGPVRVLAGACADVTGLPYIPFALALPGLRVGDPAEVYHQVSERLAERPTVLVIEDLHWADAATLGLLDLLVRNLCACRVLIVATYRDDEHRARSSLAERLHRRSGGNAFFVEALLDHFMTPAQGDRRPEQGTMPGRAPGSDRRRRSG